MRVVELSIPQLFGLRKPYLVWLPVGKVVVDVAVLTVHL